MTTRVTPARIALVLLVGLFGGCVTPVSLGRIGGRLRYTNAGSGSAVAGYLGFHDVSPDPDAAMQLFRPGPSPTIAASGPYHSANVSPGGNTWQVATYSLTVSVDSPGGTAFNIEADSVAFAGVAYDATYRFGTRFTGATGTHRTPLVLPLPSPSTPSDGTTFDVDEPACLVRVRLRFTGTAADLDALSATTPISCGVEVDMEEQVDSGQFNKQAFGGRTGLMRDDLHFGGEVIEILVRAGDPAHPENGPRVNFGASCTTPPPANSGFALNDQGLAVLTPDQPLPGSTASCTDTQDVAIDVPVVRRAGVVKGLFDVNGETESDAVISLRGSIPRSTAPPLVPAGQQPDPAAPWSVENVQPGDYDVLATAVVRAGDVGVVLPHRTGPNQRVTVANGQVTDLGATFVTRPTPVNGRLVLLDPTSTTSLPSLKNGPMPLNDYPFWDQLSFVAAFGDQHVLQVPSGESGIGGASYGRVRSTSAPAAAAGCAGSPRRCELDYTLLLTGQSRPSGALDGSETLATPWNLDGFRLSYGDGSDNFQRTYNYFAALLNPTTSVPSPTPVTIPPISVCLGQIGIDLRMDPALGTLFKPTFNGGGEAISTATSVMPNQVWRTNIDYAEGLPKEAGHGAAASVVATVSEGIQYTLAPSVFVADVFGAVTTATLPNLTLPSGASAALGCGQFIRACIKIDNPASGAATPISISLGDQPLCRTSGAVALVATVDSGGAEVDSLSYQVNGGTPILLCAPCGPDPVRPIPGPNDPPINLPNGGTITVVASSQDGCDASYTLPITVAAAATLQCPPNLVIQMASGESSIPAGDPRVRDHLTATLTGGCNLTPTIQDDRPPAFAPGQTTVHFSSGQATCSTTVTAVPDTSLLQVAFFAGNRLELHEVGSGLLLSSVTMPRGPVHYSADGRRLAVRQEGAVVVLDADDISGPPVATFPGGYFDTALQPPNGAKIGLLQGPDGSGAYTLTVRDVGTAFVATTSFHPVNSTGPAATSAARLQITWAQDSGTIAVGFDTQAVDASRALRVMEWHLNGTQLVPGTNGQWSLHANEQLLKFSPEVPADVPYGIVTSQGVYTILSDGTLRPVPYQGAAPNTQAVIHRLGAFALATGDASPVRFFSESPTPFLEYVAASNSGALIGMALSDFHRPAPLVLAIARQHSPTGNFDGRLILEWFQGGQSPRFVPLRVFITDDPKYPAFRPTAP